MRWVMWLCTALFVILVVAAIGMTVFTEYFRTAAVLDGRDYLHDPTYRWVKFWMPGALFSSMIPGIVALLILIRINWEKLT